LFSDAHLKRHERFFISNYHFYRTDSHPSGRGGTAVAVRTGVTQATGVCIPIGNSEILLASLYKSPGRAWNDADITQLLSFRRKSILSGDLNAKRPFWNSTVSNPSGEKIITLFDLKDFEISAPQCPTNYSPAGNGDVLDIVVHKNIRVSDVTVSDILDSDHLLIIFHVLYHVKLGIFPNLLKNSEIGIGFKAS
jgi:hypothetical protein